MIYDSKIIENTLVDYPRLDALTAFVKQTKHLNGAFAEVGVYKGGTARLICELARNKTVYLFDTFTGMPPVDAKRDMHLEGDFADTSIKHVVGVLLPNMNWEMTPGFFPKSANKTVKGLRYAFVHLDVDIYTSVRDSLLFFIPRMVEGGIIVIDDYNEYDCPGAKLAADEIAGSKVEPTVQSQAVIRF